MAGYNIHRGSGDNVSEYDVLWMSVLGDNGKPIASGKWITTKVASKETGLSQKLSYYIEDGQIRATWVGGRRYFLQEDVDKELKVPEGWWNLETAIQYTHLHPNCLRRLARAGQITGNTVHKKNWFEPNALKQYFDAPEGFVTYERAQELFGVSKKAIRSLAQDGEIKTDVKRGWKYFNLVDLRKHFKIPDGYISTVQAAEEFQYVLRYINGIVRRNGFPTKKVRWSTYFPKSLLVKYMEKMGYTNVGALSDSNLGSNGQKGNAHGSLEDLTKNTKPMHEEGIGHVDAEDTGIVSIVKAAYDAEAPKP